MTTFIHVYMNFGFLYGALLAYLLMQPEVKLRINDRYFYIPGEWLRIIMMMIPVLAIVLWPVFLAEHMKNGLID